MSALYNLIVDLHQPFPDEYVSGIEISSLQSCDDRTLAWIDETFGGSWSSEARAGENLLARCDGSTVAFATTNARGFSYAWLNGVAREPGVGLFGPFGVAPHARKRRVGRSLLRRAMNVLRERGYQRALLAAASESLVRYYTDAVDARVVERFERGSLLRPGRRVLVMASGDGSNFQAVLDASRAGGLPIEIVALLCNKPEAHVVRRARDAGVAVDVVAWHRSAETREAYDMSLRQRARAAKPDLVLLLGWMHLLSDSYVTAFPEMLNLHPAFLPLDPARDDVVMPDGCRIPAFRGAWAVRDALAVSSPWVGATLHRVTAQTDRGPVMARKPLRVTAGEEEGALMERVHELEREVVRAGVMRWLYER